MTQGDHAEQKLSMSIRIHLLEHGEEIERGISNWGGDDDKALVGC
jgi:hypothetical protein